MIRTREKRLLIIIVCLGAFLRLYDLGGESLWLDEAISISRAHLPVIEIIKELLWNNHPPLYFTLLRFWVALLGDSEIAVRALSVVFSLSALFVMYRVGTVLFSRETGMLGALLLAVSVFHLRYAQEARSYSLMVFLTLLSMYYLFNLLETRDTRACIGYIASSILMLFTHHHALFVLLAQNVFFYTAPRVLHDVRGMDLKKWAIIQATILILYMPWILPWTALLVHRVLNHQTGSEWLHVPTFTTLVNTFSVYSGARTSAFLFILLIILGSIPAHSSSSTGNNVPVCRISQSARTFFLLLWLAVPIAAPFVISLLVKPIYHVRYTMAALPAFYILAARGIQTVNNRLIRSLVIFFIIALASMNIGKYYTEMNKKPWREAIRHIDREAGEGDLILYVPGATKKMLHTYYSGREDLRAEGFPSYWQKIDGENVQKLEQAVAGSDHAWLVLSYNLDPERLMVKTMKEMNFRVKKRVDFRGITIFRFKRTAAIRHHD